MEDLLKKRSNDLSLRVVNFSLGHDLQTLSLFAVLELVAADEQTVNMRREIFGGKEVSFQGRRAPGVSSEQYRNERRAKYQTIADFVSKTLDESKEFKDILGSYQRLTQSMAEQGMFVVVAAGNEGVGWQGMKTKDTLNLLARSEYVISVGSAERNKTPLRLEDDNLASYSSIGQEGGWQPTLLAPSLEIPNFYGLEGSLDSSSSGELTPSDEAGTSLSAPYVAGTISLMLQKNPNLSFNEVCSKLKSASIPIKQGGSRAPSYVQGAGVLDPVRAVRSVGIQ